MAGKREAYGEQTVISVLCQDDIRGGLCAHKGEREKKGPRMSSSGDLKSEEADQVAQSTPAERGWRYWQDKGVTFAV
jgi:hypothetical protein